MRFPHNRKKKRKPAKKKKGKDQYVWDKKKKKEASPTRKKGKRQQVWLGSTSLVPRKKEDSDWEGGKEGAASPRREMEPGPPGKKKGKVWFRFGKL